MIVRQYAPCSLGRSIICLGKQGEINALRVEFDVSAWMAMYPDATVKLMHFAPDRPQDKPVIPTLGVEGTLRVWIVGEEDTAGAGNGVIELLLIDERTGSTIKSATGYTTVLRSPSAGIEAQESEPGYVRYDVDQSALLTDEQKAVARTNIDAIKDETDPTVPDWAKQPQKPTYTASEVGALPSSYTPPVTSVNGKTGEVALNAQDVRARPDTWTPSASDVGADAAGTASGAVAAHNVSGAAHEDLRALIEGLTSRLNALADSDDTTLDQLSEIVAYIKSNKTLIDAVTTGKVSVSDIVDNLTTNASGKVLSAAQGVALKAMIDGIVIPTALPNPQPITINGQRYDGSEAVTVTTAEIDDTLTQSGKAADAKAVGDRLNELNAANATQDELLNQFSGDLDKLNNGGLVLKDEVIKEDINNWLNEHPEATTTVQNDAIMPSMLNSETYKVVGKKFYMDAVVDFGVPKDGKTSASAKLQEAIDYCATNRLRLLIPNGRYLIDEPIVLKQSMVETDMLTKAYWIEGVYPYTGRMDWGGTTFVVTADSVFVGEPVELSGGSGYTIPNVSATIKGIHTYSQISGASVFSKNLCWYFSDLENLVMSRLRGVHIGGINNFTKIINCRAVGLTEFCFKGTLEDTDVTLSNTKRGYYIDSFINNCYLSAKNNAKASFMINCNMDSIYLDNSYVDLWRYIIVYTTEIVPAISNVVFSNTEFSMYRFFNSWLCNVTFLGCSFLGASKLYSSCPPSEYENDPLLSTASWGVFVLDESTEPCGTSQPYFLNNSLFGCHNFHNDYWIKIDNDMTSGNFAGLVEVGTVTQKGGHRSVNLPYVSICHDNMSLGS